MEFTFKSKFKLESVVWLMYDNKPTRGIIYRIEYNREESVDITYEQQNIFNKIKSLLNKKKVDVTVKYSLDLIDSTGKYISRVSYRTENDLFATKEELLKSL